MWASNDQGYASIRNAIQFPSQPIGNVEIYRAARRMQALEMAKLVMALGRGIRKVARVLFAPYLVWRDYQETFRELSMLDDRILADIGVSRADIPRVAAGLWVPENRVERVVSRGTAAKPANVNRPQVAA